ncbi:MAG: beta-propeller domain-containing protein [Deltaproteobacteria bacterium]|nr:beta-propeller domain-containing protein [Deltaproteobacteria bacterium]
MKIAKLTLAAAAATLLLAPGCKNLDPPYALESADTCEKLEKEIKLQAQTQIRLNYGWISGLNFISWGKGGGGFLGGMAEADMAAGAAPRSSNSSSTPRLHSDTNVQVEGVDEADLVETDGTYLYALAGDHLIITEAWPAASAHEVGRLKIEGQVQGIYLREDEDRVAVLSQLWSAPQPIAGGSAQLSGATNSDITKVTLVSVANKAAPVVERETYLEGFLHDSRVVGDRLFVVSYVDLYFDDLMWADSQAEAMRLSKNSTLDQWMPKRADNVLRGGSWSSEETDICNCADVNVSIRQSGTHMMTISSFDVTDPTSTVDATSVLGSVEQVYANGRSLYIFSEEHADGPWRSFDGLRETIIHRFDIPENGTKPTYDVSGKVPGTLTNQGAAAAQFSSDEFDGKLRIVTNQMDDDWNTSVGLYVLEPGTNQLRMVGMVPELVENEEVYAVRFIGEKAYVVTFRQIDPLFIVDLTDPRRPEVKGELEIPGFSNYLHPIDADHLLGIGLDGSVQVSLFDVSDDMNPVRDSQLVLPNTGWSEAQNDHHAFNFFAPHDALFVPVSDWGSNGSKVSVIHAKVDEPLAELGRVSNATLRTAAGFASSQYDWCVDQRRSVVIENALYAVSGAGITVTEVRNPTAELATVPFAGIDPCADTIYYGGGWDEGW